MAFVFYHGQLLNANQADKIYLLPPEKKPNENQPGEALGNCYSLGFEYHGQVERVGFFLSVDVAKTAFNKVAEWLSSGSPELLNMDKVSMELNEQFNRSGGR